MSCDDDKSVAGSPSPVMDSEELSALEARVQRIRKLRETLLKSGLAESPEAAFAGLVIESLAVLRTRLGMQAKGLLKSLPAESQRAADSSYVRAVATLCDGLESSINAYHDAADPLKKQVYQLWSQCHV